MGLLHICMLNQFPRKHQVIVMPGGLPLLPAHLQGYAAGGGKSVQ